MVEIATPAAMHRAMAGHIASHPAMAMPLAAMSDAEWRRLAEQAVEPNGYFLPGWMAAVNASARDRTGMSVLRAWLGGDGNADLTGLIPVTSLWRAYGIPLPALVSADPYGTLGTPLLDSTATDAAAADLLRQARESGAHALILRDVAIDGAAMASFRRVLARDGLRPIVLGQHERACLDATRDADELLKDALGAKKLKDLRRQRHRLAEHGEVRFTVARTPADVASALETFLVLEASGWKAKRGTALRQHAGDLAFIRRATQALAEAGQCEIVTLRAGNDAVAAAVLLRHLDRAFYFKLGVDERFARLSPGVQLTLDVTRHLCADPAINAVDSTAAPGHPMIDPIWRGRLAIGDVMIPLRRRDPVSATIHAALTLRQKIREPLRRAVRFARKRQEKAT